MALTAAKLISSISSDPKNLRKMAQTNAPRPSRAKRHFAWEQIDRESGGAHAEYLRKLATRFPSLSRTELKISVLVMVMWKNFEIAECLGICEETVQNHRSNIRRKLGLCTEQNLMRHLLTLI